jgi:hypothetical protein
MFMHTQIGWHCAFVKNSFWFLKFFSSYLILIESQLTMILRKSKVERRGSGMKKVPNMSSVL